MHPRLRALAALRLSDPAEKVAATHAIEPAAASWPRLDDRVRVPGDEAGVPGRPARPVLVEATEVGKRSPFTTAGHAALVHAICHIEFNAINLALDAAWRFDGMPEAYYREWLRVAHEEATHFQMLSEHLAELGYAYGDFTGHDGLWRMCEKTQDDVVARMALVPRTLEARGLDATPLIQARLRRAGTPDALRACAILDVILRDEVGHVAVGNRWYRWLCERHGIEPLAHYRMLYRLHEAPRLRAPFNLQARALAGFTQDELDTLDTVAADAADAADRA